MNIPGQKGFKVTDLMGNHYLFCHSYDAGIEVVPTHLTFVEDAYYGRTFLQELCELGSLEGALRDLYLYARSHAHHLHQKSDWDVLIQLTKMLETGELKVWLTRDILKEHAAALRSKDVPMASGAATSNTPAKPVIRRRQAEESTSERETSASVHESDMSAVDAASKAVQPANLAEAKVLLANRRKQIAATGYQPKYSDKELKQLAEHGDVGGERFQVRFMEMSYLIDRNTPDDPLSGKLGMVMKGESGEGAKYWSTSFDQLEDADSDPKLISEKLGLEYDSGTSYCLVIVDTQKAAPLTGVKSVSATFNNVSEFANTELPKQFSKDFTNRVMTPKFQEFYSEHYSAAVNSGDLPHQWSRDTDAFQNYLQTTDLPLEDQELLITRMEMHDRIGNNQDYLGTGLTKELNSESPNSCGVVETLNFERKTVNLKALHEAGAITIIKDLEIV
ncbi:hypothetical protein [Litoribacillus peritrichatus]|uniref:Uncharacterized protein n=1 Tax=Litoribacillus peritrichatus TaxID=718191 RepID=A0ABP7NF77_9GAMM